ncbi:porin family protein [Botryobacter ruber]|uniref:porin family protein n=1 Tax=Botryobacter ruber TaxID=2171629 RepID=UPI0013E3B3A0|nr:porin family protein [Botryobacter ruber]
MQQTVFMKVLVKGPVNLYATDDLSNGDTYLVQKPGEKPHQLRKKVFLGELNLLLSECPEFKVDNKSAKKLKFTDEKLSSAVHAYNACRYPQEPSQRFLFKDGPLLRFGLRVGTQFSRMEYMANQGFTRGEVKEQFFLAPGVTGGAFVNIFKAHKPFALQAELLFKRYAKDYTAEEGGVSGVPYTRVVNFKTNMLQLPLLLQYKLPGKQYAQPYFIAGPVFSYTFNSNFKYGIRYTSSSVDNRTEDISHFSFGYAIGAGIQRSLTSKNRLALDIRYNTDYVRTYQRDPIGSPGPRRFTFSGLQLTTGITL